MIYKTILITRKKSYIVYTDNLLRLLTKKWSTTNTESDDGLQLKMYFKMLLLVVVVVVVVFIIINNNKLKWNKDMWSLFLPHCIIFFLFPIVIFISSDKDLLCINDMTKYIII